MDGPSFGQCRICHSEGAHRNITKVYYSNGVKEIYYDMFVACFNLQLLQSADTMLICLLCVQQLRDAITFRSQVVDSEQKLAQGVAEAGTMFIEAAIEQVKSYDVKVEIDSGNLKQESDFEGEEVESLLLDGHPSGTEMIQGEAALLARFPKGSARLPTRRSLYSICKTFVSHLDSLRGKKIPSHKVLESMKNSKSTKLANKRIYMTEKLAHVNNICTLLENSNVTPFKSKNRSGYPCYYCWKVCENLQALKEHQHEEQNKTNIKRIMNKYTVDGLVMYVDVTNLKCTICNKDMPSLTVLKEHLSKEHKKEWSNVEDRVLPFKLSEENNFECQVCKFTFETFGSIERHMNQHYRNYVCEECGAGFVNKLRLKVHIKTLHVAGSFPCISCKKMFTTQQKYRTHVDTVHKMLKKNKCPKCPERFAEYFKRQKHMVEVHGLAPLKYKCNVCEKTYNRRYHLSCHMKRCHLEEKEIQCQFCSYMCYTKGELTAHLVKHNSERAFECSVCKKSYARKKTLTEHMRIHNNDRRFACTVCGLAFVQNCSLKGHIKTHHPEYVV
ncbi:zinc finger Y-chromosomal protein-like isoform X1 [Choristoneura fumiferana]|uniref:zinc finger Y-chromosomal protein-like isoform X1 n=1 Tax=Choristoneura fumiferana TaxID=7141 RepID=UPI003D155937